MTPYISISIIGMLVLLLLWHLAWRKQPTLAFGIFLGVASVCVIAAVFRPSGIQHVPVWLPALPFAIVAIALFCFGILAWVWGRSR
jgi:hypothetical protein